MKTVVVLSQKGGTGKTTLATNLAIAAILNKKSTILVDIDPQASSASWSDTREQLSNKKDLVTIATPAARLPNLLDTAHKNGADFVIIDTPPHSENTSLIATKLADFAIIPCKPSIFDLRAIKISLDLLEISSKIGGIVLSQAGQHTSLFEEAKEALKGIKVPTCPYVISQRIAFVRAATQGLGVLEFEPKGKAAAEIKQVYKWICNYVYK